MVPDFKQRDCYACGAAPMMQSIEQLYREFKLSECLNTEYFQMIADDSVPAQPVTLV
jgi:hypothetical protein